MDTFLYFHAKTFPRHRVFTAKVCIANRESAITRKKLQRHRLFGSKQCVADRMDGLASLHRLVSKNHLAVSGRQIDGAGKKVGEVGGHEDVHGYVSVAGGRNGR